MPLQVKFSTGNKAKLTLKDVRELYEATKGWAEETTVSVSHSPGYDQRERATSSISVEQDPNAELRAKTARASSYIDPRGANA